MYKKVLYNIKKMKNVGGRGNICTQNTLYVFKKEKKKNNFFLTEPGLEPTTSGFEIH